MYMGNLNGQGNQGFTITTPLGIPCPKGLVI